MNSYSAAFPTFLSSSEASLGLSLASNGGARDKRADITTPIEILPSRHVGDRKSGLGGYRPGLRALDLPKDFSDIIVLAAGDEAGEVAARDCALRRKREGRCIRIAPDHRASRTKAWRPDDLLEILRYSGRAHLFNGATGRERAKRACRMRRFPRVSA
jgi:hypothetical protein